MSGITLSASVRQNLLSLQSTTNLLSQTQERLSTGNKVNSALDNPTNYFTAQSLNNRSSDISNLLDGIGNGVQVLQAANTGITSLQSLIDTAKSIANQALQATSGYSTKSQVKSTAIAGATADNLLGTTAAAAAGTVTAGTFSSVDVSGGGAATGASIAGTANSFSAPLNVAGTQSTLAGTGTFSSLDLSGTNSISFNLSFDGGTTTQAISIGAADITAAGGTPGTASETDVITALNTAINTAFGTTGVTYAADNGGAIDISSGTAGTTAQTEISGYTENGTLGGTSSLADGTATAGTSPNSLSFDVNVDGTAKSVSIDQDAVNTYNAANSTSLDASALTGADVADLINSQVGSNIATYNSTSQALDFASTTTGASSSLTITNEAVAGTTTDTAGIANHAQVTGTDAATAASLSFNVTVDGGTAQSVTIDAAHVSAYNTANAATAITDPNSALSAADIAKLVNYQVGSSVASVDGSGNLSFASTTTGSTSSIAVSAVTTAGGATNTTGITSKTATGTDATQGLSGLELTIGATAGGTATDITFGTGTGQVSTLDQLNTALAANNLEASLDTSGKLTITTVNDDASSTIGAIGGSAVSTTGSPFASSSVAGPVADSDAQNTRATLVSQYNTVIDQIKTTAQDASFNGVNLLNGDQLKLVFDETGKSSLNIAGVTDDPTGLGLSSLTAGTDFVDNASTNKILTSLNAASSTLRSQASTLGSNLSIVQIRQDFNSNLINVLQTGSSNLTLADTNEEAANSQALSTRQSIAVSALALANTSQQSVLRLLQ